MDLQKISDPTVIVAMVGVISTILAAWFGKRERDASAADKIADGYAKLVTSWEVRLDTIREEVALIKAENAQIRSENDKFRDEVIRLTQSEQMLNFRVHSLEEQLAKITVDRDEISSERDSLWKRVEELEKFQERTTNGNK
jgi:chromosome segregation ATPase